MILNKKIFSYSQGGFIYGALFIYIQPSIAKIGESMRFGTMVTMMKKKIVRNTLNKTPKLNLFMEETLIFDLLSCFKMSASAIF